MIGLPGVFALLEIAVNFEQEDSEVMQYITFWRATHRLLLLFRLHLG